MASPSTCILILVQNFFEELMQVVPD